MKIKNNLFKIIIILINIIILFSSFSYGFSVGNMTGKDPTGETEQAISNVGQGVIKIISTVGSIFSVVVLIILGIKYMLGSVEEKAEYKKSLFPYVIGAVILFGASALANIIYNIAISL